MCKQEFLAQLRKGLSGLPQEDIEERLSFYSEMIEDRMEEGLSEEEAVSSVGNVDEIVSQIVTETSFGKPAKEKRHTKGRIRAGEMILLILGSPIWLSLGIAAFAVILSLYISIWAIILSLWAVFASLAVCSAAGVLACTILVADGNVVPGIAVLAAGMVCAGLSVFMFYGCRAATMGDLFLTKKMAQCMKNTIMKREAAK